MRLVLGLALASSAPPVSAPAGVTAYQGAISAIMNETYLPTASGIEAVEVGTSCTTACVCTASSHASPCWRADEHGLQAMHAGAIRAFLYNNAPLETPYNVTVAEITNAISELRTSVGGVTTSAPRLRGACAAHARHPAAPGPARVRQHSRPPRRLGAGDVGVVSTDGQMAALFPVDMNAVTYGRTPAEVRWRAAAQHCPARCDLHQRQQLLRPAAPPPACHQRADSRASCCRRCWPSPTWAARTAAASTPTA